MKKFFKWLLNLNERVDPPVYAINCHGTLGYAPLYKGDIIVSPFTTVPMSVACKYDFCPTMDAAKTLVADHMMAKASKETVWYNDA